MDMETEKDLEEETGGVAGVGESVMSRRERKKKDQQEIQSILEEEGVLDEEEGRQADEIDKLTGKPLPEDVLLYAVPVCGPYSAIRSFKYSVKLTPGTMKKGDVLTHSLTYSSSEIHFNISFLQWCNVVCPLSDVTPIEKWISFHSLLFYSASQ